MYCWPCCSCSRARSRSGCAHKVHSPARHACRRRLRVRHRRREPDPRLDGLRRSPARRVRHRPRQERHAVGLGHRDPRPPPTPVSARARSDGMTANGAEVRFWAYFDTTNQYRSLRRLRAARTADRASLRPVLQQRPDLRLHQPRRQPQRLHHQRLHLGGHLRHRLDRSSASSTTSRAQTYTLSKRASATDPWTPLKAAGAHRLRHPVPRRQHHHAHPRHAVPRLPERQPVARRRGLLRRRHHRARHHAAHRAGHPALPPTPRRPGRIDRPVLGRGDRRRRA